MRFIALLRGVNVGGNNKVAMSDLKSCFIEAGFSNVTTYINSGNVIFDSLLLDKTKLVELCETVIEKYFGFRVVCSVISADELIQALDQAPAWWGKDNELRHNALFVIAPKQAKNVLSEFGPELSKHELVEVVSPIIFWSVSIKNHSRTRYSKIVGTKAYKSVTIRNYNTTKKLAELCKTNF